MTSHVETLIPGVKQLLAVSIERATEAVIQQAMKDFETQLRKAVATAAFDVSKFYEVSANKDSLVITVKDVRS